MKTRMVMLGLLLGLGGCGRGFFAVHGVVASDGGALGQWRKSPQGCSRDPFDGRPVGQTTSVLTFVWEDPGKRDGKQDNNITAPDAPMRIEVARLPQVVATVYTKKNGGTRLDAVVCRTLRLETGERAASYPEGRPTLGGTLQMDCLAGGSHVTADLHFSNCEY